MTVADLEYRLLLEDVRSNGDLVESRNGACKSLIDALPVLFLDTPLVTVRRTAWRLALREMEWFLSGEPECPPELMGWWQGQLNPDDEYLYGYGAQLRSFDADYGEMCRGYDQIQALITGIREHPNSRRLLATTWHPWEMNHITAVNGNPRTPTTCHGTIIQAHVRNGALNLTTYQRSADIMLGVPHNWIQYWALLLWLAYHCHLKPGTLRWLFGDLHLYQHETHLAAAAAILDADGSPCAGPQLRYEPADGMQETPVFYAAGFLLDGTIPEPVTTIRPALLA